MRAELERAREALSVEEVSAAGSAFRDILLGIPQLTMGGTVAAYYSVGTEPDTRKLVTGLWKHGVYVLLPVCLPGGVLDWAAYDGPDSVAPARFGLMEPTGPRYGPDALARVSAVVTPAMAVDQRGFRLGKGAGFYDRALARTGPHTLTIGVIYDTEFVSRLPAEPHDVPVRAVATPGGGIHWIDGHEPDATGGTPQEGKRSAGPGVVS
ncbi:5-formyltetrahydrofolate cyclo-ligase [Spiractinospora alimapuensis]|nr:5-formyltetrahydrofolate cyclo-ligase [Spiractinospora alimapuensis]QVQ55063.1 5-formyltetrahydrofolate cyclo-ligase [Spiractinospora alimapuensis]